MWSGCVLVSLLVFAADPAPAVSDEPAGRERTPVRVGSFPQESRVFYGQQDGLPSASVRAIAVASDQSVWAATDGGLAVKRGAGWRAIEATAGRPVLEIALVRALNSSNEFVFFRMDGDLYRCSVEHGELHQVSVPEPAPPAREGSGAIQLLKGAGDQLLLATSTVLMRFEVTPGGSLSSVQEHGRLGLERPLLSVAVVGKNRLVLGDAESLTLWEGRQLRSLFPQQGNRRWAPGPVRDLAVSGTGDVWMASQQGAALWGEQWELFEGSDGLPYNQLTSVAVGQDDTVWFGTPIGAIRRQGGRWHYRQGRRWLPGDEVRAIAIAADQSAWIGTDQGISQIRFEPMTLHEKAEYYQREIDQYHRRTEYGYVLEVDVPVAGSKENAVRSDSDNDGLWTAMYGVGECYAYGATKDPASKQRAQQAFQALKFLLTAPEGSEHAAPSGFVARTVVPTTEPDPNTRPSYTRAGQELRQANRDSLWRVYEPRWPKTADGKFYWKSDTSSDELDGHYYFYPLYYDLVAETEEEKAEVREVVRKITDHLIDHDYFLVDHAGKTRWGVYNPEVLNGDPHWFAARGIKSLSILSYLNVAYHMTGDQKYRDEHIKLRDKHHFFINVLWPEYQRGIGSGNHSDDEMFLMGFYNLIKYEPDADKRAWYLSAMANWWRNEEPEVNPYFNFTYAALAQGESLTSQWGTYDLSPWPSWLDDSIETLRRFPLDRFNWGHRNSHRDDIVRLTEHTADPIDDPIEGQWGYRVNGKVLPVDERYFNHWNHNPWRLDVGGDGRTMGTGAVYTLSYYTGLYYGFIE